jgi:outer membrane protein OmpA-like peptidoglycan-associated protein
VFIKIRHSWRKSVRLFIISTVVAGITLSGCTTNPTTGQSQLSKTGMGAGAGVLLGAIAGAATGNSKDRGSRMLKGAAIGGVLGGGVGVYMDRQEAQLRQQMQGTGVDVQRNPETGAVDLIMPGAITFSTGRSDINPAFAGTLNQLSQTLNTNPQQTITVRGYTDNVGSVAFNQQLSKDRADSVANYLVRNGVAPNRLQSVGYGMSNPVASNETELGRGQNRRVELSINPPASVPN